MSRCIDSILFVFNPNFKMTKIKKVFQSKITVHSAGEASSYCKAVSFNQATQNVASQQYVTAGSDLDPNPNLVARN